MSSIVSIEARLCADTIRTASRVDFGFATTFNFSASSDIEKILSSCGGQALSRVAVSNQDAS